MPWDENTLMLKILYLFSKFIKIIKNYPTRVRLPIFMLSLCAGLLSGNAAGDVLSISDEMQGRKFTAASSNNFPPVNLLNDDGQLTGFGPDLSRAVITAVGGEITYLHSSKWIEVLDNLDSGRADFIHDTGLVEERKSYLDYSDPIMSMPEVIFVNSSNDNIKSFDDLSGRTVACVRQHITHIYLKKFPEIACHVVARPIDGILALIGGEVDAFVYPEQIVAYLARQKNMMSNIKIIGQPIRTLTWHMTVKKGNLEILNILNAGIGKVRASGEYKRIYNKWYKGGVLSGYSDREILIISVGAAVFLIIGGSLAIALYFSSKARFISEKLLASTNERDGAITALVKSEQRFKDFAVSASHWMWETDTQNRFKYISSGIEKNTKTPGKIFLNKTRDDVAGHISGNIEPLAFINNKMANLEQFEEVQYQIPQNNGGAVWVEVNGKPFFNQRNEYAGYRGTARNIAQRKNMELEHKKSEERYRNAAQLANLGNWIWDLGMGKCIYCSAEYAKIFGVSVKEYKTLHIFNYKHNEWIHQEDRDRNSDICDEAIKFGREIDIEYRVIRKDGEVRNVREKITPILGASGAIEQYAGVTQDITELKQAELRSQHNLDRVNKTLESIRDIFFTVDDQWNIMYANSQAHSFFDNNSESVIELNLWDTAPEMVSFFYKKFKKIIHDQQPVFFEGFYSLKNTWYDVRAFPSGSGISIFLLDITKRKMAESQAIQSSKLATLGQMASGIAHEMNQPLNIISMTSENMISQIEDGDISFAEIDDKLKRVLSQSGRMSEIINHMRTFSKESNGHGSLFKTSQSVVNAVSLVEQQFYIYDIAINVKVNDHKSTSMGSAVQLEQVIMNLLSNAKDVINERLEKEQKHKKKYTGSISIHHFKDKDTGSIIISVEDNGGGIDEDKIDRIFDPFYSTKEEGKGTGLGLSISYSIIQSMGGTLTVANTESGARFKITLPAHDEAKPALNKERAVMAKIKNINPKVRNLKILVVDDEELAAEDLAEYLERKGHSAQTATDGEEAFKLYKDGKFDVIITDLRMPKMDGYELMKKIHKQDPNIPIFIITGHTTVGEDREIEAKGAVNVLTKPISLRQIAENLNQLNI